MAASRDGLSRRSTTGRDRVDVGDATIEYEVRRSARRRKTVEITVDRGVVHVAAPSSTPDRELRDIVRARAPWILRHLARATPETPSDPLVSGATLPYLGRNVRMVVETAEVPAVELRFDHWRFRIAVPPGLDAAERDAQIRSAAVAWYRARAAERLTACVERWWPRLGREAPSRVLVRDQRRRWGSCAHDGTLRFNWRVVMLEPGLIEYVVVHELAHLTVPNHSPEFWATVSAALPDVPDLRRRLRAVGSALPL